MSAVLMGSTQSVPKGTPYSSTHRLLALPNELLLFVAGYFDCPRDLSALLLTNHRLSILLTPLLHKLAIQDRRGRTALQWAAYRGHIGLAKLVLSKGFNVNDAPVVRGWPMTPLYYAVKSSRFALVKLLLDHGAHLDTTSEYKRTPVHAAVRTLIYLEERQHREPNLPSDIRVFRRRVIEMPAVLLILLRRGANLQLFDGSGYMALHDAARFGTGTTLSALKMLLDAGAPINSRTLHTLTPLHCAADLGSLKAVGMLLQRGADVGAATAVGFTPLHYAAFQGYDAVAKLLVKNGGDWAATDKYGRSPKAERAMKLEALARAQDVRGRYFWGESCRASNYDLGAG